jgi:hypothetical protein
MYSDDPGIFLGLDPQPRRFDATVRIDALYSKVLALLRGATGVDEVIRQFAFPDPEALDPETRQVAEELAARAALQSYVDSGDLVLNVYSPASDRFFKLPPGALRTPFVIGETCGEETYESACYTPVETWRTGRLEDLEYTQVISAVGNARLPVLVTKAAEKACLNRLGAAMRPSGQLERAVVDEQMIMDTIRRAAEARGGRLTLEEGKKRIIEVHGDVPRDVTRALIRRALGPLKPGPRGPRKRAGLDAG